MAKDANKWDTEEAQELKFLTLTDADEIDKKVTLSSFNILIYYYYYY